MKFRHSYAKPDVTLKGADPFADPLVALASARIVGLLTVLGAIGLALGPGGSACMADGALQTKTSMERLIDVRQGDGEEQDAAYRPVFLDSPLQLPPLSYRSGGEEVEEPEPYFAEGGIRYFLKNNNTGEEVARFSLNIKKEFVEGVEDDALYDVPPHMGPAWKNVSYVEGKEVSVQRMPAREEPYNVNSSTYIVVPEGQSHTIPPGKIYTSTASVSAGFEGWNYEVNEHTVELPAGTYVGPTDIYITGNATVSFTKDLTHPIWNQNPDPNQPPVEPPVEPPVGPVTPVDPSLNINPFSRWHKADPTGLSHPSGSFDPRNTLFVYNFVQDVSSLPYPQAVALCLENQNARDFSVFNVPLRQETNLARDFTIYSNTPQRRSGPVKNVVDSRFIQEDPSFNVKTEFDSFWNNVSVDEGKRNCLIFAYPVSSLENTTPSQRFAGKTRIMTFDIPDSPRWDVHKVIENHEGVIELLPTKSSYTKGEEIASVNISFGLSLEDVNGDGVVDEADRAYVFQRLGFEGTSSADIWSERYGLGIPDGKVTQGDLDAVANAIANR